MQKNDQILKTDQDSDIPRFGKLRFIKKGITKIAITYSTFKIKR